MYVGVVLTHLKKTASKNPRWKEEKEKRGKVSNPTYDNFFACNYSSLFFPHERFCFCFYFLNIWKNFFCSDKMFIRNPKGNQSMSSYMGFGTEQLHEKNRGATWCDLHVFIRLPVVPQETPLVKPHFSKAQRSWSILFIIESHTSLNENKALCQVSSSLRQGKRIAER